MTCRPAVYHVLLQARLTPFWAGVSGHLFDADLTQLPAFVFVRDFNDDELGFVLRELTLCHTRGQTCRIRLGDFAQLTHVVASRHQSAARQISVSGHYLEVWHGTDETMSGDVDREWRVDVVRHTWLDDESRPPASILWLWQPLTHRRRECVHVGVLQDQAGVIVCIDQTHCHIYCDGRVQLWI